MKKKMALLLVFAMIVTTSITVPFISFADSTTGTTGQITAIYGVETVVKAAPTKSEDEKTLTAEYKYTAKWNSTVKLTADKQGTVKPDITVTSDGGSVAIPNNDVYSLVKNTNYTITLSYTFKNKVTEQQEKTELSLKTQAQTTKLTPGTPASLTDIEDEEKWYFVEADPAKGKGMVFSLLASDDKPETRIDYKAEIYDKDSKSLGVSTWSSDYDMMFECPLILEKGTYYIKLCPSKTAGAKASLNLTATAIPAAEVDVKTNTPTSLDPENTNKECTLYSFVNKNKKISGYWYKISPTITGAEKARYEIGIDFGESKYGDVEIELLDDLNLDNVLESEEYAYVGGDRNTFYAELYSGEKYYLKLTPRTDIPATKFNLTIKRHTCEDAWFVSEADNQEVSYGCSCGADDAIKAMFTLDAKVKNAVYTGDEVIPETTLVFDDWWTEDGVTVPGDALQACYTVSYKNSKKESVDALKSIGTYTATVKFHKDPNSKNSLAGLDSITKTVKVVPAGTTLKKVTAAKKGFTVKWNAQTTKTTGYQIQYSTSSKFTKSKTVTISKNTTVSKKVTKLSAKKKYYVRVRTYKTVNKTKYYSSWSPYKSVTTNK